jgi:hypothetical protein
MCILEDVPDQIHLCGELRRSGDHKKQKGREPQAGFCHAPSQMRGFGSDSLSVAEMNAVDFDGE